MNDKLKNDGLKSILIVESSEDETNRFIDVVQSNCDAKVSTFKNSVEAILWLQTNFVEVVILEENLEPMGLSDTLNFIQYELKRKTPVFVSTHKLPDNEEEYQYIQKPFTYESLHKLCSVKIECEQQVSQYSLEYLKEVSGGNMEFISGSLEIFQTSVKKQLQELEKAGEENDHKKIGEIAHNIKPSFEMLLNEEAAALCNELTYNLDSDVFPQQIAELRNIFEKINKQLESDFATK